MLGSGGPTFSVEDLHIVKGPTKVPQSGAGASADGGENTPKTARPILGMAASPSLARHTSYRSEPPTAPVGGHRAAPAGVTRSGVEDISGKGGSRRLRVLIWAGLAAIVAAAAVLIARR